MITTHVLDVSRGRPAAGVAVVLERRDDSGWSTVGRDSTDADGRATKLFGGPLAVGQYRLTFDTGAYFAAQGVATLYPSVIIVLDAAAGQTHYHVPLLLSPFGYTTYRGS